MLPYDRQQEILRQLETHGHISIHRLAQLIHVSEPTMRRDLVRMEKQGLIRRTYGGAVLPDDGEPAPLSLRKEDNAGAKRRIAAEAVKLLRKGATVYIDSASTVQNMIAFMSENQEITVITNSLSACQLLTEKRIKTYCVGGLVDLNDDAMRGKYAEDFIRSIRIDQAFFSCSSVSSDGVLGGHNEQAISLLHTVLHNSRQHIFLCTYNKIGRSCMHTLCSLRDIDQVICDQPLPAELAKIVGKNRT
ncbi:MAG: DeoR/GlpR transcriptional regulator [Clostridia bacterium]|nr:DeoR/GlpR transcriptional regulator [Clostridia bacterium]